MELIVFCGLQASGKTSFFRERFARTHAHVSLDVLRTRRREEQFLRTCFETKMRCVVDNTNPTKEERARYVALARAAGFSAHLWFFRSRVSECADRNDARDPAVRVPRAAILGTSARLELPARDEGYDSLWFVSMTDGGGFAVEEWRDEVR